VRGKGAAGWRTCSPRRRRAGPEEAVETEINEKLADEKFVESSNVGGRERRRRGEGKTDSSGRRINYVIRHDCHVSVRGRSKGIRFLGFILSCIYICRGEDDFQSKMVVTRGGGRFGRERNSTIEKNVFALFPACTYIFFFCFSFFFFYFLVRPAKLSSIKRTLIKRKSKSCRFFSRPAKFGQ